MHDHTFQETSGKVREGDYGWKNDRLPYLRTDPAYWIRVSDGISLHQTRVKDTRRIAQGFRTGNTNKFGYPGLIPNTYTTQGIGWFSFTFLSAFSNNFQYKILHYWQYLLVFL